jgi:hypothetical protein
MWHGAHTAFSACQVYHALFEDGRKGFTTDVTVLSPGAHFCDAQNPSPVVTTFRGYKFVVEWEIWIGKPLINLAGLPLTVVLATRLS